MNKLLKDPLRKAIAVQMLLGLLLFPFLGWMDFIFYPGAVKALWIIRGGMSLYLIASLLLLPRLNPKFFFPLTCASFAFGFLAVSLMCFVSGEGMASPYYAGNLVVIIGATAFFPSKKNYFVPIVSWGLLQHFLLLTWLPWEWKDALLSFAFLGGGGLAGGVVRHNIHDLVAEIRTLKKIIPVCCRCKKMRDDKGYWEELEEYFSRQSGTEFSHGFCPACFEALYGKKIE